MAAQSTVDRHKRRADLAEERVIGLQRQVDDLIGQRDRHRHAAEAEAAEREAVARQLLDLDSEARLLADIEAAMVAYEDRAARSSANGWGANVMLRGDTIRHGEVIFQPALESPFGRVLLHAAMRHGVAIEASTVTLPASERCEACGGVR